MTFGEQYNRNFVLCNENKKSDLWFFFPFPSMIRYVHIQMSFKVNFADNLYNLL